MSEPIIDPPGTRRQAISAHLLTLIEFRLRRDLALHMRDGTEAHGAIREALGPVRELHTFTTITTQINRAVQKEYCGCIHIDDVVTTLVALIEDRVIP